MNGNSAERGVLNAEDRARLERIGVSYLVRTPEEYADWMIAEFETYTGESATDGDRADALESAREAFGLSRTTPTSAGEE